MAAAVQVWTVLARDLDQSSLAQLLTYLSPIERQRLDRIKHGLTQRNFLVGRGCLRYLLGRHLGQPPASLTFTYGSQGKPELDQGIDRLGFNLSHSGDYLAIAIADRRVGVDVESVRDVNSLPALCERCLTPREQSTMLALSQPEATRRFFRYWTAKEAYLKGLGVGLSQPLEKIQITLTPLPLSDYPQPLGVGLGVLPGWHIYQWQVESNYLVALACPLEAEATQTKLKVERLTVAALLGEGRGGQLR